MVLQAADKALSAASGAPKAAEVTGLTAAQATQALQENGPNELPGSSHRGLLVIARETLSDPMFALLLAAGVLYLVLGDLQEGLIMFGLVLVVLALGFFTSARIAEQVRAGVQALPRGQRYAGMALGLTTLQTYRYVILPMAFRIIMPPLTSESMNLLKNSSVAFAVSIAELTMFAMQAQEETSRGVEIYIAVTALYAISAFAVNRAMSLVEKKLEIPGYVVAGSTGGGH